MWIVLVWIAHLSCPRQGDSMNTQALFSLEGKTAVVTGATGLLGRYNCRALAEVGATVVAMDLDQTRCDEVTAELGNDSFGHAADVCDPEAVQRLLDSVLDRTGRVDVLVNNAAINDMFESPTIALELSRFENYPLALWQRSLDVNVTGVFLCSRILGARMAEAGQGSIINVASTYGIVSPDQSLYRDR